MQLKGLEAPLALHGLPLLAALPQARRQLRTKLMTHNDDKTAKLKGLAA
jgi:hypothetical protein